MISHIHASTGTSSPGKIGSSDPSAALHGHRVQISLNKSTINVSEKQARGKINQKTRELQEEISLLTRQNQQLLKDTKRCVKDTKRKLEELKLKNAIIIESSEELKIQVRNCDQDLTQLEKRIKKDNHHQR